MTDTTTAVEEPQTEDTAAETPQENDSPKLNAIDENEIIGAVEALIFSGAQPIPSQKISEALGKVGVPAVKKAVAALNEKYEAGGHAFRIRQVGGGYQFYILPDKAEYVKAFYTRERKLRLTKAALETMAIIAYKQPVSKNQIEYIRGVASDGVISNLLEKNLIRIAGRSEAPGRPLLYAATDEFLKFFGINSFDDLPKITEVEEMIREMESERLEQNASGDEDGPAEFMDETGATRPLGAQVDDAEDESSSDSEQSSEDKPDTSAVD